LITILDFGSTNPTVPIEILLPDVLIPVCGVILISFTEIASALEYQSKFIM
jgi:hypothetical protein